MLADLLPAFLAAALTCVAPGWFWTTALRAEKPDPVERLAFSTAFSMALVPPVALAIMWGFDAGVGTAVALLAPLIVFVCGLAVRLRFGPSRTRGDRPASYSPTLNLPALVALVPALGLLLWANLAPPGSPGLELSGPFGVPVLTISGGVLVVLAGVLTWTGGRRKASPSYSPPAGEKAGGFLFSTVLAAVLSLVLARGYAGPALYDWPYLRGGDQYNHAVQANEMLAVGHYDAFLVYPPGFSTLTASVSRVSGLEPLEVFPVLAPALILLPAVACYALAKDLWGRWAGLAAAATSGLLLNGVWENISDARYPNLVSAQFLLVLMVAALIRLYRSPGPRPAFALALLGSSVVLYHSVGTFYAVLLLAPVATLLLPLCLLARDRKRGVTLLLSLALLGVLSVLYAWDTYELGELLGGLLTGTETGAGGEAVSIVVGTQPTFPLVGLPERVSPGVFAFAVLGLLLLFAPGVFPKNLPGRLSQITLLLWCGVLFVGSRTALSAFPQRFERDLGIPLSILAALGLVVVFNSLAASVPARRFSFSVKAGFAPAVAVVAGVLALSLVGAQAWASLGQAAEPEPADTLTPEVAAAGEWLKDHNSGGRILPTPSYESTTSRGMLALGGYDGLQAYPERRVRTPRSLPPGGAREIKDARWMLLNPNSQRARNIIGRYDLRYAVLSKSYPGVNILAFENGPYRRAFENESVVVFEPEDRRKSG